MFEQSLFAFCAHTNAPGFDEQTIGDRVSEWSQPVGASKRGIDILADEQHLPYLPVVSVKLDTGEFQRLKAKASRLGVFQSEILRQGLKSVTEKKAKSSLADRMRDLIGKVSAPEDLSTNPAYLNAYGK